MQQTTPTRSRQTRVTDEVYTPDRLDEYNFRSAMRTVGRDYRDDNIDDRRIVNDLIARYANTLLHDTIATELKIETTQHNEFVIITHPDERSPLYKECFVYNLRVAIDESYPASKREFVNQFRDNMANLVCRIARQTDALETRT